MARLVDDGDGILVGVAGLELGIVEGRTDCRLGEGALLKVTP